MPILDGLRLYIAALFDTSLADGAVSSKQTVLTQKLQNRFCVRKKACGGNMKVFFVYAAAGNDKSEYFDFTQRYIAELKKHCETRCAYLSFGDGEAPSSGWMFDYVLRQESVSERLSADEALYAEAASFRRRLDGVLRIFKPDVIHCARRYAFLPFRTDKNVFYSTDLNFDECPDGSVLDEFQVRHIKAERTALTESAIAAVYSDAAAQKAKKLCGGLCSPVVVPCGIDLPKSHDESIKRRLKSLGCGQKCCVSFFGGFDNASDGVLSFIFAVNRLGRAFKSAHGIRYCLYGRGLLNSSVSLELFDEIAPAPEDAFCTSDIVVLPRTADNLGYAALNAMANGALVLTPRSLASDRFCTPSYNCLDLPRNSLGIARAILDAVVNFRSYLSIADNARRTAVRRTIGRAVQVNLYAYKRIAEGRADRLSAAYNEDVRGILSRFFRSHDTEKLFNQDLERLAALKTLAFFHDDEKTTLVLTGACGLEQDALPRNTASFSVLAATPQGITLRPECLPFADSAFDTVILTGAWEAAADPCSALSEIQRVAKENVVIVYNKGQPRSWQHIRMDESRDWTKINTSAFYCSEEADLYNKTPAAGVPEASEHAGNNKAPDMTAQALSARRNAELTTKLRTVIRTLSERGTLDAVVYTAI